MSPAIASPQYIEDPLVFLPCSTVWDYSPGQTIYSQPSNCMFLVVDGMVKLCRTTDQGKNIVLDVYLKDELFGESALLGMVHASETAVAINATKVMRWTLDEIEGFAMKQPRLAIAILQLSVKRSEELVDRIQSFSVDNIRQRLARALVHFSKRFGVSQTDGSIQLMPLTHKFLSQYIGTSREVVTSQMNALRHNGYLHYSRRGIRLNNDRLKEWLFRSEREGEQ